MKHLHEEEEEEKAKDRKCGGFLRQSGSPEGEQAIEAFTFQPSVEVVGQEGG